MNDFTIRRVTDPKEGPIDGVSAETVGVYTKFRGKAYFRQRNVSSSRKQRM